MPITISALLAKNFSVLCRCCVMVRGARHHAYNPAEDPHLAHPVSDKLPPVSNRDAARFMLICEQIYPLHLLLFASLDLKLL